MLLLALAVALVSAQRRYSRLDANENIIKPFCELDFKNCQRRRNSDQNFCDTTKIACYENPPVNIKCQVALHQPQLKSFFEEQGLTEEKCDASFCFSDYKEKVTNRRGHYDDPNQNVLREFQECASGMRSQQIGERLCTDKESQAFGEIVKAQGPCGDSECACLQKFGKHLKANNCFNKEMKLNVFGEYSQCPIVWPAKGEKKCMSCFCRNWEKATATYSNCRPYTMYTTCPGSYCVKCQSDGKTPMPGHSESHDAQCKTYETSSAEAQLKEMLRELLF